MERKVAVEIKTTKVQLRSIIKKYISDELYIEVLKVTLIPDVDNNEKYLMIKDIFNKYNIPYSSLGSGTNRAAFSVDGYCLKFALDKDGMVDSEESQR